MKKGIILAADVGGTKTDMGLYEAADKRFDLIEEKRFINKDYGGIEDIIGEFLKDRGHTIHAGCFGIAAPIEGGASKLTNLRWVIDSNAIKKRFGIKKLELINDIVSIAWGLPLLSREDVFILHDGPSHKGNIALMAPGTGLGEGAIFWEGKSYIPMASEGGHSDFAPRNTIEVELLIYLSSIFGHVSCERVLSGPGLKNIYDFLTHKTGAPPHMKIRFEKEDPPFVIIDEAEKENGHGDEISRIALELFVSLLGAEAGNLALKIFAKGGVFIGGGIAPNIIKTLKKEMFINAFTDKGRFKGFLSNIPVYVILNPKAGLIGAANYASGASELLYEAKGFGIG